MIITDFEYLVNQKKNPAQGRVFVVLKYYLFRVTKKCYFLETKANA